MLILTHKETLLKGCKLMAVDQDVKSLEEVPTIQTIVAMVSTLQGLEHLTQY